MIYEEFTSAIEEELGFTFTSRQREAAEKLAQFVISPQQDLAFILRGYAGTGKTSLVAALVKVMQKVERRVCLLAPTGRAAKVLSTHAHTPAYTIHRMVYRQETFKGQDTKFDLGFNKHKQTLFVVDEASMISNKGGIRSLFGTGMLLDDLIQFVYSSSDCKLLFVGDTAQLPPVEELESPALDKRVIEGYGLRVTDAELTEVVRQMGDSDILTAATHVRDIIAAEGRQPPQIGVDHKGEVRYLPGNELIEALEDAYAQVGIDETIVVTRSNKRANAYNEGIRARIFDRDEVLTRGDLVMAVKNNYYWTERLMQNPDHSIRPPFDFIANGERAVVSYYSNVHEQYGFEFADATLRFPDYDDFEIDCRILLSTLRSESPSLTAMEQQALFERIEADYAHIASRAERMKALRKDAYYNALQIKYAYAVTCHKAQGGQWERVFIDQGWLPPDMDMVGHLRWLYTAFTRAKERLYLVNWRKEEIVGEEFF